MTAMAKTLPKLKLGPDRQEYDHHGTPDFPCELYFTDLKGYVGGLMPEHWHSELELGLVTKGQVVVRCGGGSHVVSEGQGWFINANSLHSMELAQENGQFYSLVFHENLIHGPESIYRRYVRPVICAAQDLIPLNIGEGTALLRSALSCFEEEGPEWELDFLTRFNRFWLWLYRAYPPSEEGEDKTDRRVREMLRFIAAHYAEDIGTEEIAQAASISKRECYRCFKAQLNSSPNTYLMGYRLNRGAELLLLSGRSVELIALECGFSSATYFSTRFKRVYGMTPTEYRTRNKV